MSEVAEVMVRTASGKEAALVAFQRALRRMRPPLTISDLAERARVGRAHLESVLNAHREGGHTWKHIMPHLSPQAMSQLKQCSAWNKFAAAAWNAERRTRARLRKAKTA